MLTCSVIAPIAATSADTVGAVDPDLARWLKPQRWQRDVERPVIEWSPPSPVQIEHVYAPTILKDKSLYRMWYTDVRAEPWSFRCGERRQTAR